jgi:hypothetical protein
MENKTHYRKVFKSDHLGVADLEEFIEEKRSLIFTIKQVKQEFNVQVAGRKGNHNIAYFIDGIKPLVLNSTNSKIVKSFNNNSPFVEDWKLTKIELYIDYEVKMKGEKVGGVRIKLIQPKEKVKPQFNEKNFEPAHKAKASLEIIKKSYSITEEVESKYLDYVAKNG